MAERRMFSKTIVDSDTFLELPLSAQCLYFHLNMRADDDGFVNSPRIIQRMIGASDADRALLADKRLLLTFDSGVIAITHWRIHNYIRRDTYRGTLYTEEKAALVLGDDGAYSERVNAPSQGAQKAVDAPSTQDRLGKDRIGQDRIGQDRIGQDRKDNFETAKPKRSAYGNNPEDTGTDAAGRWHLPE